MYNIIIDNIIIEPYQVLSSGNNFMVYKGVDQVGNEYTVKTAARYVEGPLIYEKNNDFFNTHSSKDLMTSAWYGHEVINLEFETIVKFITKQAKYIELCGPEYNISTYGLHYDIENDLCLVNKFVPGQMLELDNCFEDQLLWKCLPSLIAAVSKFPHGDLKENHILIHNDGARFSILDPATSIGGAFETNSEYYPVVPPLFHKPHYGYMNFCDQLAIGIMIYKALTGCHPFEIYKSKPYWVREFGNGLGGPFTPELLGIYPFMTRFPEWFSNNSDPSIEYSPSLYVYSIKNLLLGYGRRAFEFKEAMFNIPSPQELNGKVSRRESDFCLGLLQDYRPFISYIEQVRGLF